jgi:two-component sensor histidine kinase
VPTLDALAPRCGLDRADLDHLHRLLADWQLLADLSFADLLLWLRRADAPSFVVAAQLRPTTGPTAFPDDRVGAVVDEGARVQLDAAWREGRICRETDPEWIDGVPVREETIPVRRPGARGSAIVAVISRHTNLASPRAPSRLELTYVATAADLAKMVAEGSFPFPGEPTKLDASPRVGDGLLRLDLAGRVTYASPNALSAYRRIGLAADLEGVSLGELTAALAPASGAVAEAVTAVVGGRLPRETEIQASGTVLQLRAIPLLPGGRRIGALVLVRDVTELRRRDVQLLSKDATIREIHHRVKNNLQTVAALLRLQARRLDSGEARAALDEAVRRVGSIALVHEMLSQTPDETVPFDQIADRVIAMVRDLGADGRARVVRAGEFGRLPAGVATPLAVVLTELLQNALEHGLAGREGTIQVRAESGEGGLRVVVTDDGAGLPPGFSLAASDRLGLSIVRTLVTGELGGSIALDTRAEGGTVAVVTVPPW